MAAEVEVAALRYNTVAASQTAQALTGAAATGAPGDIIEYVDIIPASTSPGAVTLVDGSTSIVIFAGGAGSVADLKPFPVLIGARSRNAPWKVTTGANVSVFAVGRFT